MTIIIVKESIGYSLIELSDLFYSNKSFETIDDIFRKDFDVLQMNSIIDKEIIK